MRSDLPTGTVTFLFTDVAGSTKLLHSRGDEAYADALAEHRRVIREACTGDGGVEVDTQGDAATFFAFAGWWRASHPVCRRHRRAPAPVASRRDPGSTGVCTVSHIAGIRTPDLRIHAGSGVPSAARMALGPRRSVRFEAAEPQCSCGSRGRAPSEWPREESNLRTQIRSLPLYPLSYGAGGGTVAGRGPGRRHPEKRELRHADVRGPGRGPLPRYATRSDSSVARTWPERTRTTAGSNWLPARRSSSARASGGASADP